MSTSQRAYYLDAYTRRFTAAVVEQFTLPEATGVVLDRTFFYPTSGGQPHDTGRLGNQAVRDVFVREEDGAVVHVLAGEPAGDPTNVYGEIDWARRLDHMQHHTGQHILSQAFIEVANAATVGFHLGSELVTIDLDRDDLTPQQVAQAEQLANEVVWQNRPVQIHLVTPEEAAGRNLRKLPEVDGDMVRLIDIQDFDLTACGGTHVAYTAEVGLIKVVRLEKRRGMLRVYFLCGGRALADYGEKNEALQALAAAFTTSYDQLLPVTEKLRQELKEAQRQARQQQAQLVAYEAAALLAGGERQGTVTVVSQVFAGREAADLRLLARELVTRPGVVALLGTAGERPFLVFARSEDVPGRMDELLRQALATLGGRGGGNSQMAQGGSAEAQPAAVQAVLQQAVVAWRDQEGE